MGINSYTWTKHADERLMQRFLISKSGRQSFVTNFMTNGGKFVSKELDGTEIWESGDIVIVVNPESQTIITVYHKYQKQEDKQEEFNKNFLIDLAEQSRVLKKRVIKENTATIQQLIEDIVSSIPSLKNTHDEIVDKGFDTLYKNTEKLKVYLDGLKDYRSSADKIRERRL